MATRASRADRQANHAAVEDPEVVLAAGLRFLEVRSRSVEEVRRRLSQAGYRPELTAGAIERLISIGLLDDALFARLWIESRDRARPRGEAALRRELSLRGVDRELINAALEERRDEAESAANERTAAGRDDAADGELSGSADEAAARRLIERRQRDLDRIDDPRRRQQRAYALLARHGFDPGVCRTVAASVASAAARP
jgi:regulatory protein